MSDSIAPARPSASVVIVRDGPGALEVLMLRRNEKIAFHGGAWVFPGGRVDADDRAHDDESEITVARQAAAREVMEETGLGVAADALLPFAHWTTPVELPKRFATWFFAAAVSADAAVTIDQSEIVDFRWLTPAAALAAQIEGELQLPAPTFVTLLGMRDMADVGSLKGALHGIEVQRFEPRIVPVEEGRCTVYREDAAYETGEFNTPGPRHRLLMQGTEWQYIRDF
jgi:8-oxo-dGTP pyrophosphatase MutT (NUDIX family)